MSNQLTVNNLDKDFKQIYVGNQPTNIFINSEGKIKTKSYKENVNDDNVKILANKIKLDATDLVVKSSNIHLDGDKNIILDDTTSQIKIVDPANSSESLKVYHNADDAIISTTDSTNLVLGAGDGQTLEFWHNGGLRYRMSGLSYKHAFHYSSNDYFEIDVDANGATVMKTVDASVGTEGDLSIEADGDVKIDGATAHHIELGKGTGFTQQTVTYDATDTDVDFRQGNKQYLELTGNITDLNLKFPALSGNFVLLVKQDGSTRTISNYKAFDRAGNAANGSSTVKFSGGSNPDLTDGGNKVDIISLYWDATAEICYGVASLNF